MKGADSIRIVFIARTEIFPDIEVNRITRALSAMMTRFNGMPILSGVLVAQCNLVVTAQLQQIVVNVI